MYVYLTKRKNLTSEEGDTRSGMFNSLAEWSAKVVNRLPEADERSWQPNLLIPAQNVNDVVRSYKTIYNLARPKGSVKILGFGSGAEKNKLVKRLPELCDNFMEQGISAAYACVHTDSFLDGFLTSMQSLKASFFTPNTLFGAYLYVPFRKVGLGLEKTINLWIDLREVDRDLKYSVDGFNIGLLTAYLLKRNWKAKLNIIAITREDDNPKNGELSTQRYMDKLMILARMPKDANVYFVEEDLSKPNDEVPRGDLNILSLKPGKIDINKIREQSEAYETSILYTMDSGRENALA